MNVIDDILTHKDGEIIEYLAKTLRGVLKNYNTAIEKGDSALLYVNIGDITMVASVLSSMDKRNKNMLAMKEEQ